MLKLKNFLKNFFILTTWKDNDKYPSLIYNNLAFQKFAEITGFAWLRVILWNFIAKRYPPFNGFYPGGTIKTKNNRLDLLYSRGYILEEDFLSKETHIKYSKIFEQAVTKFLESEEFLNSDKKQMRIDLDLSDYNLKDFEEEVANLLIPLIKDFYKTIKPTFRYQLEVSKDGTDYMHALSKWHIDRFIPSLKSLYFPLGVNVAPFSYIEGSHLIDKDWKKNTVFFRLIKNYQQNTKKGMMLKDELKFPLDNNLESNIKELNNLEPNTMYLGAHQGLHRKKPFDKKGHRFHVAIEFTHSFSKYDLFLGAIRGK